MYYYYVMVFFYMLIVPVAPGGKFAALNAIGKVAGAVGKVGMAGAKVAKAASGLTGATTGLKGMKGVSGARGSSVRGAKQVSGAPASAFRDYMEGYSDIIGDGRASSVITGLNNKELTKMEKAQDLYLKMNAKVYYNTRQTVQVQTGLEKYTDIAMKGIYWTDPNNLRNELARALGFKEKRSFNLSPRFWSFPEVLYQPVYNFSFELTPQPTSPTRFCHNNTNLDWTYNYECSYLKDKQMGPDEWHLQYPDCSGKYQSPVDIVHFETSRNCSNAAIFRFIPYESGRCTYDDLWLDTNVQSWGVVLNENTCEKLPSVQANGIMYNLWRIEFSIPGEHTIDGRAGDGEIRMFLTNIDDENDTIGVAVRIDINEDYDGYSNMDELWSRLAYSAKKRDGIHKKIDHLLMPNNVYIDPFRMLPFSLHYYTYFGSLTQPPCSENIKWVVYPGFISVSKMDFEVLRNGISSQNGTLMDGFGSVARQTQPLVYREVHACYF